MILRHLKDVEGRLAEGIKAASTEIQRIGTRLTGLENAVSALQLQQANTLQELLTAAREQRNIDHQQEKELRKIERKALLKQAGAGAGGGLSMAALFELGKQIVEMWRHH